MNPQQVTFEISAIEKLCKRDNPWSHSHTELKTAFDSLDPNEADQAKADYAKIATDWKDTVTVFAARIRRSSESAWSGPAADASRQAIADYATDATNLTPALQELSSRVGDMVSAVIQTKTGMPEVRHDPQDWYSPGDWGDGEGDGAKAEAAAQQHVKDHYVDKAVFADSQIPVLPQPRDPVAVGELPPVDDKKGWGGDTGGGGYTGGGGGTGGGEEAGVEEPGEEPGNEEETTEDTNPDGTTTDDTTEGYSTDPASTTAANTVPSSVTPANSTTPASASGFPGSSTGGGFPGSGGGSGGTAGLPGSGLPGAGRSIAGSPVAVPTAVGAAGAGGAAGTGAGRGMPMMGAPGAGRAAGGDDEKDRKTPDYLINEENARELLGDEPRTIPGGVLGADIPAARPADGSPS